MRSMAVVMAFALTAGSTPTGVSFVLDGKGGVIVPVTVGALRDLHFLVDTGSTRSVISETIAQQLALHPVARTEIVTTAGTSMGVVAALPPTCLATRCVDDALAIVTAQNALASTAGQLDGILGSDVLTRSDFTIDYKSRRFAWGGGSDAGRREDRLPFSLDDGRAIVVAPQTGGLSLQLVADSGTDAWIFFDSQRVRSLARLSGPNRFSLQTLGGVIRAERVLIPLLRLGSAASINEIAAVVPRPAAYPQAIDGLMPLHRFASVSFRHSESAVIVRHR